MWLGCWLWQPRLLWLAVGREARQSWHESSTPSLQPLASLAASQSGSAPFMQTNAHRRASTNTALTEELARSFASVATELAQLRAEVDSSVVKQRRLAEQAAALPAVAAVGLSPAI